MDRLDEAVDRELRRFGPAGDAPGMAEIVRVWPAAVGDTVCRNAWPARLARDGTLHVSASSSTWAFELGRLAGEILEQLAALWAKAPARCRRRGLPEPADPAAGRLPARPTPEEVESPPRSRRRSVTTSCARSSPGQSRRVRSGRAGAPPDRDF